MMNKRVIPFAAVIYSLVAFSLVGCSTKTDGFAFVSFYTGSVALTRGAESRTIKLKDKIVKGDIISTGANSFVIVQMPDEKLFRIEANSSLSVTVLDAKEKKLALDKGLILAKISKLKKEETFEIKTQVAIASVRGTQFLLSFDGSSAMVSVKDGKVEVTGSKTGEVKPVEAGRTAVVAETSEIRDVTDQERTELDKLDNVDFIKDVESATETELKETGKKILDIEKNKLLSTLDEIRNKYKRIDVVTLYTGQIVKGAIISRGKSVKMVVPGGEKIIDPKKIKRTESY